MRYLEHGAAREDVSLVFLPARAASVAMALSSTASFVAVVFLARLTVNAPLETGHIVLVAFTAAAFLTFVCTGLIIAYARFLPPPTTRIWDLVRGIVSYLALLWVVCASLSGAVLGEVLLPLRTCTGPYPSLCLTDLRIRSTRIIAVLSVALAASLALCILVTLDLRSTHPQARVVILRSELAAERARAAQARRVCAMQAALEAPSLRGEGLVRSDDEDGVRAWLGGEGAEREASRRATVRAYAARARLPVDDPEAAWLPADEPLGPRLAPAARRAHVAPVPMHKDALGVPIMFSPGKRHRHAGRRREPVEEEEERSPRRRRAQGRAADEDDTTDDSTSSSRGKGQLDGGTTTASSSDDVARARAPRASHHHHHHAAPPSPSSTSATSSSTDDDGSTTDERAPGKRHHERASSTRRSHSSSHHHAHEHGRASAHHHREHHHNDERAHERRHPHHERRASRAESSGDSEEEEDRRRRRERRRRKRNAEARTADVNAFRMETASAGAADAA